MTQTPKELQDFLQDEAEAGKTITIFVPGADPLVLELKDCTMKEGELQIKTDTRAYRLGNMPYIISEKKHAPSMAKRPRYTG